MINIIVQYLILHSYYTIILLIIWRLYWRLYWRFIQVEHLKCYKLESTHH